MQLSEDENIFLYGKHCGLFNRKTILPYEYELTCFSCGYNVIKRKNELSKKQRRKTNFVIRLKYAELKIFCICVDVYKIIESNDYDKIYEVLSTLRNKKLKINDFLIEKNKDMSEKSDFEKRLLVKNSNRYIKNWTR